MPIPKSILKFLDSKKAKYEIISHRVVYTAQDKAATLKVDPKSVIKTVVVKIDKDYAIALISANKNLDKIKLRVIINKNRKTDARPVKSVEFAKEAWMKNNIPGKIGANSPFSCDLPVFVDNILLKQNKFIVNSGEYNQSFEMTRQNFEKAMGEYVKGNFSKTKK